MAGTLLSAPKPPPGKLPSRFMLPMSGNAPPHGPWMFGIWSTLAPKRPGMVIPSLLGAKEAGNGHSELRAADGSGVGQNAGSVESRIGEHGFVGCGRIEHMRSVHHHQLRIQILNHIRRVRKRPRWCPPNANWVLVGFDLATVRPRQLCIVADRVIEFPRRFPPVLGRRGDKLVVVPTVSGPWSNAGSALRIRFRGK